MKKEGYPEEFSAALNAAAAVLGPIIPPGIPMVFLALITNLSIGRLFFGALIPGLIMAGSMHIIVLFATRKMNLKVDEPQEENRERFGSVFKRSVLSLIAPVIIIAGVLTGMATVTEIAILACAYVLVIGIFVYRTITLKSMFQVFCKMALFSSIIMALFTVADIFSYIIAVEGLSAQLVALVEQYNITPVMFLLGINIFFLFLGMIMDATPAMLIFGPVLLPIANQLGIDSIHFGMVMICNLMIGLVTPPVGALLFIESKLSGVSFERITKASLPFIVALLVCQLIITYVPWTVTWLPNLIFGIGGG